ncbi:thymus-specific serine protease-like isoform X2 [Stylophora pistillata]|uniref:thymus-specific serine protease-like isoform X2 n=1 Tax=Stylophora pistillata TaxID=50429 RepID=UPI000C03E824|nr:thymus-specific serine protease-like isoform X2 [Stylophora pistillata]
MERFLIQWLLLLAVISHTSCFQTEISYKIREYVREHQYLVYARHDPIEEYTLEQPLDHFEPSQKTLKQRYWVNANYWRKEDGPVFLYIGGEAEISGAAIDYGNIVALAEQYSGLLFAVEHRYYGLSTFEDYLETENLKYLSSQQALADLAEFCVFAQKTYKLTDQNQWVAYGGSYPGNLAAWFRLKYPHLVKAAVASSAPVQAKTDFQDYKNVAAASFASPLVGGSMQCQKNIMEAFAYVNQLIAQKDFTTLERDFLSCNDISQPNDTWLFVENIGNFLDGIVQYNSQAPAGFSIAYVCQTMTNASLTPYQSLGYLIRYYLDHLRLPCVNNNYTAYLEIFKNTTQDPTGSSMIRQWIYQTCTQFGYYQTCEKNTSCIYSKVPHDLEYDLDICFEAYDIPAQDVYERVAFTNAYYGGKTPKGSKIVFVNASCSTYRRVVGS